MKLINYLPLLLLTGLLCCQKPTDAVIPDGSAIGHPDSTATNPTTTPTQGVVYEKGTPLGQPVQKVIGPEGGTLASADGTLKMSIPAGAVSKATTFSMQPVTPTLPGLIGGQSFRLLPEGQTFAQPIQLQYRYNADSLDGTSPQLLVMAYQGSDGYWRALPGTELDESTRTLTVSTKHFSDWGTFAEFRLNATPAVVFPGQTAKLSLVGYTNFVAPLSETGSLDEVVLAQQQTLSSPENIKNWHLSGKGGLDVSASRTSATYSAPANLTQGTALITVDIYNFLPPKLAAQKGASGKAVIMKTIKIEGAYFRITVDGKTYDAENIYSSFMGDKTIILGGLGTTGIFSITINKDVNQVGQIPYTNGEVDDLDGKAEIGSKNFADLENSIFTSWYNTCEGDREVSPGSVSINQIDAINGQTYLLGSCKATLYHLKGTCKSGITVVQSVVSADFRVKAIR